MYMEVSECVFEMLQYHSFSRTKRDKQIAERKNQITLIVLNAATSVVGISVHCTKHTRDRI